MKSERELLKELASSSGLADGERETREQRMTQDCRRWSQVRGRGACLSLTE